MRRIIRTIAEWWIVVPFAGLLGLLACAVLSAFSVKCDVLGLVSMLMAGSALFGLAEEPMRSGCDCGEC